MLASIGDVFSRHMRRWIPDPFVFALVVTLLIAALAWTVTGSDLNDVTGHWYRGFWMLLEFGMQAILILTTGYAIALSPFASHVINRLAHMARTPGAVYVLVLVVGSLLSLISWGWIVLTAILARELAKRVEGVDYAYLVACVYLSGQPWVGGLSSTIPLVMNTDNNFLVEAGVVAWTIPTQQTLGGLMNFAYIAVFMISMPLLMWWMRPDSRRVRTLDELRGDGPETRTTVAEEAEATRLGGRTLSDQLNHSSAIQLIVAVGALWYCIRHFATNGFDIDLNLMIFIFLALGLLAHRTPMRYVVAMKRACANVSGIVFQYPFYAGIMGITMFSGLGAMVSSGLASGASISTLPLIAHFSGALINFAIPSAGGEWAVIGPALTEAALSLTANLSVAEQQAYVGRIAMAVAYGETTTNLLQPFYLLVILPVMGAGVVIQARDVMGYLIVPFIAIYSLTAALVWLAALGYA